MLPGEISCKVTDKAIHFHAGTIRFWVKNTSPIGDASGVFLAGPNIKLVPEKKTGAKSANP
jgi:hypothetical protein